jgi:hypothetical protein
MCAAAKPNSTVCQLRRAQAVVPTPQTFCKGLPRALAEELGDDAAPHSIATGWMVKVWFGNKDLHYECGVYLRRKVVELGLHFESDAFTNQLLLGAIRVRAKTITNKLPAARIEAWDKGWARIWEPIPLETLDEPFSDRITKTLAKYVRVLEPILEDALPADVRWSK